MERCRLRTDEREITKMSYPEHSTVASRAVVLRVHAYVREPHEGGLVLEGPVSMHSLSAGLTTGGLPSTLIAFNASRPRSRTSPRASPATNDCEDLN
jgi:hypothetical protein